MSDNNCSMNNARADLKAIFEKLDKRILALNCERQNDGQFAIQKAEVTLLGQMSLLVSEKVSLILSLAQTGDMDALLTMDYAVKVELTKLLKQAGLIYDEDSPLIWIPKGAKFEDLFDFTHVKIRSIDPESALVSKAVKAPGKNKQLIRQAIASGKFPGLVDRILESGGNLEVFADG